MKYSKCRFTISMLLIAALLLAGCSSGNPGEVKNDALPSENITHLTNSSAVNDYAYASDDRDDSWDASASTTIQLKGSSAEISGGGAAAEGGTVTITQAGTYVLSGTLNDGQILIDAGKNDVVRLVLNGVSLANTSSAPVYAKQADKTILILASGTENTVTDAAAYVYADGEDEPDAAIFAKDDLTITGSGSLTVNAQYNNGIGAKDMLVITGGAIAVTAQNDGLRGRDGVAVKDGQFAITAGNDGVKSNDDTDAAKGFIILDGGTFVITAGHDGVQAETALTINGGQYEIVTGGGADNAPVRQEDFRGGGGWNRNAAQQEPAAPVTDENSAGTEDDTSDSMKAFKAGTLLMIHGGTFTIDAEDDAVHANGDVTVTGGSFAIQTGDDGFHADNALVITGGDVNIAKCFEGLEGATVDINEGTIFINADDDAVNAAGGSDGNTSGPMGQDRFTANSSYYIRITGGTLEAVAAFDGLDANGNIFLDGGTVYVNGPSMGTDGAVDCDGSFTITGGVMIAAGSAVAPSPDSTQASLLVSFAAAREDGSILTLKDDGGNTVLEYTARTSFAMSAMTSPDLKPGKTYSLYANGEKLTDVTLGEGVTAISDDGGAYANPQGGFGGGGIGGRGGGGTRPARPQDGTMPERPEGGARTPGEVFPEGFEPPAEGEFPESMPSL